MRSILSGAGASMAFEVAVVRRDGFDGEIELGMTDLPIIAASILLVGWAASTGPLLGVVALAGSLFVLHLARETWSADLPADLGGSAPRSLLRGVAVNLLSPHPYLFWLTVGAPTVIAAAPEPCTGSPTPLTPMGFCGSGFSTAAHPISGGMSR